MTQKPAQTSSCQTLFFRIRRCPLGCDMEVLPVLRDVGGFGVPPCISALPLVPTPRPVSAQPLYGGAGLSPAPEFPRFSSRRVPSV